MGFYISCQARLKGVWCFSHLSTICLLECSTAGYCCSHFAVDLGVLTVDFDNKYGQMCAPCEVDQWHVWKIEEITYEHRWLSCVTHGDRMLLIFFYHSLFYFF